MNQNTNDQQSDKGTSVAWVIVIILLFCVILSACIYLYLKNQKQKTDTTISPSASPELTTLAASPTASQTNNLLTYTNDNFKYTFSYPNAWKVSDRCFNKTTNKWEDYNPKQWLAIVADTTTDQFPMCESDFPQTNLIVRASVTPVDINGQMEQSNTDIESEELINGVTWAKQIYTEADEFDGAYVTYLYNNHNGTGYMISYPNTDAKGTHSSQIDEIINSFKFSN